MSGTKALVEHVTNASVPVHNRKTSSSLSLVTRFNSAPSKTRKMLACTQLWQIQHQAYLTKIALLLIAVGMWTTKASPENV